MTEFLFLGGVYI